MELKIEYLPVGDLVPYDNNARKHGTDDVDAIAASIREFGFSDPIGVWKGNVIVEGHGRLLAAKQLGMERVPVIRLDHLTDEQRRAYALAHNKTAELSEWNANLLDYELADISEIDMAEFGFDIQAIGGDRTEDKNEPNKSLAERFIIPPFSVFDTKQGYWKDRVKTWEKGLGLDGTKGRSENLIGAPDKSDYVTNGYNGMAPQTSEFDPVLAEVCYKFFCPAGGQIIDPFAGGSIRGAVAELLGFHYTGFDIRKEQIAEDIRQCETVGVSPCYICADSMTADKYVEDDSADLVFTCPPYFDLEVYSESPGDISNMSWDEFKAAYSGIISCFCRKLRRNRFFVVVIGDVRDNRGFYRGLVDYTRECLTNSGLHLYNDIVLLEQPGTAAIRAARTFNGGRKVVKTHQNVIVCYKGDPKAIKKEFGEVVTEGDLKMEDGDGN